MINRKIIFLVSGTGGTLKFLFYAIELYNLDIDILYVIGDRECGAIEFARKNNLKNEILNFKNLGWSLLKKKIDKLQPNLIITNIHKIIPENVLNISKNNFLNLHYSLLPAFKGVIGMKTVDLAKKTGVKFIGATAHLIDEKLDEGEIISQFCFNVNWELDKKIIYNKVFRGACLTFFNAIIVLFDIKLNYLLNNNNKDYNPKLRFDINMIDDKFWKKLWEQ